MQKSPSKKWNILVSNDDGIESEGIHVLAKVASQFGRVTIVAPHRERSTSGHSLTFHKPLRIIPFNSHTFATTGTPADCIYLGTREILSSKPDVILSGINMGANLGTDIHYSGTVSAAREGALMNIPSFAFSLVPDPAKEICWHFSSAAVWIRKVLTLYLGQEFPQHSYLNINIPNLAVKKIQGIQLVKQGFRYYSNTVLKRIDPRGKEYYWIGGPYLGFEKGHQTDCNAICEGYISVSPMSIDSTHFGFLEKLSGVFTTNSSQEKRQGKKRKKGG